MFWSSIWKKSDPDGPRRGFLIVLGCVITVIWFAGGLIYVLQSARYVSLLSSFEALGAFLERFFAPLAFLWLVIGLFVQQREIAFNSKVVQRNSRNADAKTKALEATELRARQSSIFQIAESV